MKEYRASASAKIILGLFAIGSLVGDVYIIIRLFDGTKNQSVYMLLAAVGLPALAGYMFWLLRTYRITITDTYIEICDGKTRRLELSKIKGYRITTKMAFIDPKDENEPTLKIGNNVERREEIISWLKRHYHDLNVEEAKKEEVEILHDADFGTDEQERRKNLKQAKNIAGKLGNLSLAVGLWVLIYPKPYLLANMACVLTAFAGLIAFRYSKGLMRLGNTDTSAYPNAFMAVLFPQLIFFLRMLIDYDLLNYKPVWALAGIVCLFLSSTIFLKRTEFNFRDISGAFSMLFVVATTYAFGFGCCLFYNCYLDNGTPEVFHTTVVSKYSSGSRRTSYYFKLNPWGPRKAVESVNVSHTLYKRVTEGQSVDVYLYPGKLKGPWYEVSD